VSKYIVLPILLICLACAGWVGSGGFFGGGSGDNYSDIVFWWRCEAADFTATNGTDDYTAWGDTTGILTPSAAINTDAVKLGTNGLDCPTNADYIAFTVSGSGEIDELAIGFWYYRTTFADNSVIFNLEQNVDNKFRIYVYDTDGMHWSWEDGNVTRTSLSIADADLDATTWYYIECKCDVSTDYREVFVDGVSKGSSSAEIGTFTPDTLHIGNISDEANDIFIDEVRISTDKDRDFNELKTIADYPN